MACIESNLSNTFPRWIGVVKELHDTQDEGIAFKPLQVYTVKI